MPITVDEVALEKVQRRRQSNPPMAEIRIANSLNEIADALDALNRNMIELLERLPRTEKHP